MPPQSTVVFEITLPGVQAPVGGVLDEEDEEVEVLDELVEELTEELLWLDDELLLDAELEALLVATEHSFTPPATLVPAPKVTSPQTKLPDNVL